jgi:uncharacterized membrane protein
MNPTDIRRIREAGLITVDQEQAIVAHFKLDHGGNRFLTIVGIIGAILVSAGIILLIASNWESVPRLVKVASGVLLLLLSHGLAAWLSKSDRHPILAEVCHLLGSGMFLANIALIGQVYHLSSRPPNAILLWLAGIIPLAWILRSRTQHILSLIVFGLWLGMEMNTEGGGIYFRPIERQASVYVLFGILFAGLGLLLRRTSYPTFGPPTEKFGLLAIHIASFPFTLGVFYESRATSPDGSSFGLLLAGTCTALWLVAVPLLAPGPNRQWTWVWSGAQLILIGLACYGIIVYMPDYNWETRRLGGPHWFCIPVLFGFCLLQAQYGLLRRSPWMVNLAVVFIGIHIITAYLQLFGSMQTTGMMFVVSGILLIGLAFYLERKRRKLMQQMSEPEPPGPTQPSSAA